MNIIEITREAEDSWDIQNRAKIDSEELVLQLRKINHHAMEIGDVIKIEHMEGVI